MKKFAGLLLVSLIVLSVIANAFSASAADDDKVMEMLNKMTTTLKKSPPMRLINGFMI